MDLKLTILILLNFYLISLTALISLGRLDLFWKQYFFWIIGFLLFFSYFFIDYRLIFERNYFFVILAFSIIILILVLFTHNYPKSWFSIGPFSFQPSEFSKIGFFILFTKFLSYYQLDLINFFYLILSSFTLIPFVFFIFLQPDYGMILLYFLFWLLSVISFLTRKELIIGFLILSVIFAFSWFFVLKDYQKQRIIVLINPNVDPLKSGYNLRQIKVTLASSSFFGKGVGLGEIGRLGFLPSAHTDFILTFLIEERGYFIFILYSFLLFLLIFQILKAQRFHKDPQIKNFLLIVASYFLSKYILTTIVNFGIFPIVGLPVPFLSYGGSHLIFDLWLLGIVLRLSVM